MKLFGVFAATLFLVGSNFAQADIYITELDLEANVVEIINDGGADVDISSWWICNRVNGSPFYSTVASSITINGASREEDGVADLIVEAGDVLVLDVAAGFLPDSNGEFSFYNSNSFSSAAAIEEYIAWGGDGIRDNVADAAGIWTEGDFIDVATRNPGESIQLTFGEDSNSSSDYFFGTPTFGSIPEPSAAIVLSLGLAGFIARRKR